MKESSVYSWNRFFHVMYLAKIFKRSNIIQCCMKWMYPYLYIIQLLIMFNIHSLTFVWQLLIVQLFSIICGMKEVVEDCSEALKLMIISQGVIEKSNVYEKLEERKSFQRLWKMFIIWIRANWRQKYSRRIEKKDREDGGNFVRNCK